MFYPGVYFFMRGDIRRGIEVFLQRRCKRGSDERQGGFLLHKSHKYLAPVIGQIQPGNTGKLQCEYFLFQGLPA
ncbi:hypothetical protein LCGC14_1739350 [marine sediment metagenome]|uniref:Uncharacterized protein n=1 Tax=marine sediment metagenome TaxID=412755 RepID=A0A0F9H742_9ZZZZ